ncbi:MAG TPA: phosphotransferase [Dehalococcoidia bacterium]|nr:phosphotransferase [Dehalococcoidia bacterium]
MGDGTGIPQTAEEITPHWLTRALRAGGSLGDARVSAVRVDALSEGVGFVGQVLRVTPSYDGAVDDAPRSLIAKMPSPDAGAREIAALYGLYEREYQFYRQLAGEVSFRTPRCLYSAGDAEAVNYVLLLEDLAPSGRIGDQVAGCSVDDALTAVRALAVHHAQWWQHELLDRSPWLGVGIELVRGAMEQAYGASWERFLELFGTCFSQDVRDVIPTLDQAILKTLDELSDGPFTIAHGDYRADNLFFGHPGSGYDVAVIDWQSPNKAWGAYDLAYFICGSFSAELRHKHEAALRDAYFSTLLERGVRGYGRAQFDLDYARSLLVYLAIFVVNGATLDPANDRGLALFRLIFERLNGSIGDARALSYLP